MWHKIKIQNPVAYFDATGSVLIDVPNQNKPLFYSIVAHDIANRAIIPIGEFVTTSQTTISISEKLAIIRENLNSSHSNGEDNMFPKIIVFTTPLQLNYICWRNCQLLR